jgi:type IV pilus assembly protein PilO
MALKIPKLEEMSFNVQLAILGCMVVLLAAVSYFFYFRSALEQRKALQTEVSQLEASLAQSTAIATQLGKFEKELSQLQERLEVLRAILPDQKETPEVLRGVQKMAASSNLKIVKFQPQPVLPRNFYSDWPIQIEVQGYYDALGLFFEKISEATRIINIENITIKGVEGSTDPTRTLQAVCTATTFVFREETAAPTGH